MVSTTASVRLGVLVQYVQDGRRRIDHVLDPSFVVDIQELSVESLRERRNLARQEESDLSYVRRMLQGRLEVVRAELGMTRGQSDGALVERLTSMLTSSGGSSPSSARVTQAPTSLSEDRRYAERLMGSAGMHSEGDFSHERGEQLISVLKDEERSVSDLRAQVQDVIQGLTMELGQRYKTGGASPLG